MVSLGVICWFILCLFHQRGYSNATPVSRLDLLAALVWEHRFEIDSFHDNTPDKATINGHLYSDKAPGTVAITMFTAGPVISVAKATGWRISDKNTWLLLSWSGMCLIAAILSISIIYLLKLLLVQFDAVTSVNTALFIVFGTMAWPYATMMYSHSLVIAVIIMGMWHFAKALPEAFALGKYERRPEHGIEAIASRDKHLFWAGFFFGWALNSEYTSGIVVLGVPLLLLWRDRECWSRFLFGLIGPCCLIPLYSLATVGVPWKLPYSYQLHFPQMQQGLYAIGMPDAGTLVHLLFSPSRGLIFWSPILLLAIVGYWMLYHSNRKLFWITYALPIIHCLIISGRVWDWPAGPSYSARYLAPIIPMLAIPCAAGINRFKLVGVVLGSISVILTAVATITDATPSINEHRNPLFSLNIPLLLNLDLNPNLLMLIQYNVHSMTVLVILICLFSLLWLIPFVHFIEPAVNSEQRKHFK